MELEYENGWFAERSRVYKEISERKDLFKRLDSTFFYFTPPDAGWIDMEMYLNGKKRLTCDCSVVFDPFVEMTMWLEDIVKGIQLEHTMRIDCEGREVYLHYEMLRAANFGFSVERPGPGKEIVHVYDANTDPEIGLFFVYDSDTDSIPFYALCETKDFVNSVYLALLALCGNCYNTQCSDFVKEWFYDPNQYRSGPKWDNLTFYNDIKSPLIEWNMRSPYGYGADISFRRMPKIKETVCMWCDFGDALFWGRRTINEGACIGDVESIFTDTAGEIRLDSINGLREWYNEYDSSHLPEKDWSKKRWNDWQERGFSFAMEVRKLLPDTIDLFYYDWYPRKKVVRDGDEFESRCPMIVFNENCLLKKKK